MVTRRTLLQHLGRGIIFVASYPVLNSDLLDTARLAPTPPNVEGPFYAPGAPMKVDLREKGDSGTPLTVSGSLVDTSDRPIPGGLIEVWHTDSAGEYDHNGFRYRASVRTKSNGQYGFETFMPGAYGSRPRHIHYKITAEGFQPLVTQLYFENDPFFEGRIDSTLRKDPIVRYRELIRPVVPFRDDGRAVSVQFKICLSGNSGLNSKIFLEQSTAF